MSSTNIYLVTTGDYSDYRVVAAFSSRDKAQAYIDAAVGPDRARIRWRQDYNIEDYPLDPPTVFGYQITVVMARNGIVTCVRAPEWTEEAKTEVRTVIPDRDPNLRAFTVATDSKERAVKVSNELRTQMIAMDQWPEVAP